MYWLRLVWRGQEGGCLRYPSAGVVDPRNGDNPDRGMVYAFPGPPELERCYRRNWLRSAGARLVAYVSSRTPADGTVWLAKYPLGGLIQRTIAGESLTGATLW